MSQNPNHNTSSTPPPSPFDSTSTPPPSPFNAAPTSPPHDSTPAPDLPWYAQMWATVAALVVCAPIGIFLMWKYRDWEQKPKVIATIVSLLFFVNFLPKSPEEPKTRTSSTATTSTAINTTGNSNKTSKSPEPAKSPKKAAPATKKAAPQPVAPSRPERADSNMSVEAANTDAEKPKEDESPRNVEVLDIDGVGKREVGAVDDVFYVVLDVEKTPTIGNGFSDLQADGQFYILTLRAHNSAKKTHDVNTRIMKLLDDQGREFDPSTQGLFALPAEQGQTAQIIAQVQPGTTKTLTLVYDAPADASGLRLKIPGGFLSTTGEAVIRLPK